MLSPVGSKEVRRTSSRETSYDPDIAIQIEVDIEPPEETDDGLTR